MKTKFYLFILFFLSCIPYLAGGQIVSVSGYVKNDLTGKVIQSVTITESNSGIGTITNKQGYYKLILSPGKQNLKIFSTGFKEYTSKFKLYSDTIISVNLKPEIVHANKVLDRMKDKKNLKDSLLNSKSKKKKIEKKN